MDENCKLIAKIEDQGHNLAGKVAEFTRTLSSYKELFLAEVGKLNDFIQTENGEIRSVIQSLDHNMQGNEAHLKEEQVQLSTIEGIQNELKREVEQLQGNIQNLVATKVEDGDYQKDLGFFRDEHLKLKYAIQDFNNRQHATDNFIEKYVPLRIQSQISETMAAVIGRKEKKRLFEFEQFKMQELHNNVLEDTGKPDLGRQIRNINARYNIDNPNEVKEAEKKKPDTAQNSASKNASKYPSKSPTVQSKETFAKNESDVIKLSPSHSKQKHGESATDMEDGNLRIDEVLEGGFSIESRPGEEKESQKSPIRVLKQKSSKMMKSRNKRSGDLGIEEEERYTQSRYYTSTTPAIDQEKIKDELLDQIQELIAKQDLNFKKVDYQLQDFKTEMKESLQTTEYSLQRMVDESQVYLQSLHTELDGFVKKRKNDKKQTKNELDSLQKRVLVLQQHDLQFSSVIDSFAAIVRVCVNSQLACLVENISVQQALEMQEEEDRKNGQLLPQLLARKAGGGGPLGLKHAGPSTHNTSLISAGTEQFDPNQSMIVGSVKQSTSAHYLPSNVTYRKFSFTRTQLISIRTHLLFRSKDMMNSSFPFKDKSITPRQFFDELNLQGIQSSHKKSQQQQQHEKKASENSVTMERAYSMSKPPGAHIIPSVAAQDFSAYGTLNKSIDFAHDYQKHSISYGGIGPMAQGSSGNNSGRGVIYQHRAKTQSRSKGPQGNATPFHKTTFSNDSDPPTFSGLGMILETKSAIQQNRMKTGEGHHSRSKGDPNIFDTLPKIDKM